MLKSEERFYPNIPDEARADFFKKEVEPRRKLDFEIWEHKYGWSEKIYG